MRKTITATAKVLLAGMITAICLNTPTLVYAQTTSVQYGSVYVVSGNNKNCTNDNGTVGLNAAEYANFINGIGVSKPGVAGGKIYLDRYACCYEQTALNDWVSQCQNVISNPNQNASNPWFSSSQGDLYIKFGTIPTRNPSAGYFLNNPIYSKKSQFTYSSRQLENPNYYRGTPTETAANNNLSYNKYNLFNFESNSTAPPSISGFTGWYDYLNRLVRYNVAVQNIGANSLSGNIGDGLNNSFSAFATPANTNIVLAPGINCNIRGIFLIDGNLTIRPSVGLANSAVTNPATVDACLFIVKGNVTVTPGRQASTDSQARTFGAMAYDQIQLGVLAQGNIDVQYDANDPLRIEGFLAGRAAQFNRDVTGQLSNNFPSVWVDYDPRYVEFFKQELKLTRFSTREKGYTNSL